MTKCNYKYNVLACGFVTKKSNTIGLNMPTISNPVFAESTMGVQEYAYQKNIKVILGNSHYKYSQEENLVKVLRESQLDGLIITTTNLKGEVLKSLVDEKFPLVLLFSTIKSGPISGLGAHNDPPTRICNGPACGTTSVANDRKEVKTGAGHDGVNTDCSGINYHFASW
jgi:DNA-binding LacI/PurR family transcriptional regulator